MQLATANADGIDKGTRIMTETRKKSLSRRRMMLVTGGAVAGAGALMAAPYRRSIKQVARRVMASTTLGRSVISLADASYDEWANEVGATFSLGAGTTMQLVGVRPLPTSGARPDNVRQQGFAAFFDPQGAQSVAPNLIYTVYHSSYGAMLLYLGGATSSSTPRRMVAVFN